MQTLLYRQRALGDNVFHVPCRCKAGHSGDVGNVCLTICLARAAEQMAVVNTLALARQQVQEAGLVQQDNDTVQSGLSDPKEDLALYFLLMDQILCRLFAVRGDILEHGRFIRRHSEHLARCGVFYRLGDTNDRLGTAETTDIQSLIVFHRVIPPLNIPALSGAPGAGGS